jgi:hypothetical protein
MSRLDEQRKLVKEQLTKAVEELKKKQKLIEDLKSARQLSDTIEKSYDTDETKR